jgi:hypothetical protein
MSDSERERRERVIQLARVALARRQEENRRLEEEMRRLTEENRRMEEDVRRREDEQRRRQDRLREQWRQNTARYNERRRNREQQGGQQ